VKSWVALASWRRAGLGLLPARLLNVPAKAPLRPWMARVRALRGTIMGALSRAPHKLCVMPRLRRGRVFLLRRWLTVV